MDQVKSAVARAVERVLNSRLVDEIIVPPDHTVEVQHLSPLSTLVSVRVPNQGRRVFEVKVKEVM